MRVSILQMTSSDQPTENLALVLEALQRAEGTDVFLTPEVTNCVSLSRDHQNHVLEYGPDNSFVTSAQDAAKNHGLWCLLGSIALKTSDPDGRFANRSILISDKGRIAQWYDKMHMFDVTLANGETYQESRGYRPGTRAVVVDTPFAKIGMTICYDLRFPYLFRSLAQAGAQVITVPSAFAVSTGRAHWHSLLRARAIETGCFIVAPAQVGKHPRSNRTTFGHSLVVNPWGEIIFDAGMETGVFTVEFDLGEVDIARRSVPSFAQDQSYSVSVGRQDRDS